MKEFTVYPGEYILMPEVEKLAKGLKKRVSGPAAKPPVNMDETRDGYLIEVAIPGVKREEMCIYAHDRFLTIVVLHNKVKEVSALAPHEFETKRFERDILLPKYADIEFASAEYKEGVLLLHLPKASRPLRRKKTQLIVY